MIFRLLPAPCIMPDITSLCSKIGTSILSITSSMLSLDAGKNAVGLILSVPSTRFLFSGSGQKTLWYRPFEPICLPCLYGFVG